MNSPFLVFDYLEVPYSYPKNFPINEFVTSGPSYTYSSGGRHLALYTLVMANGQNWLACADADLVDKFYIMSSTANITLFHPARIEIDKVGDQWRINLFEINSLIDARVEPYGVSRSLMVKIKPIASAAAGLLIAKLQKRKQGHV